MEDYQVPVRIVTEALLVVQASNPWRATISARLAMEKMAKPLQFIHDTGEQAVEYGEAVPYEELELLAEDVDLEAHVSHSERVEKPEDES